MGQQEYVEALYKHGIQLVFTEKGRDEFARMIQDGCPRGFTGAKPYRHHCHYHEWSKDNCYECWVKWLEKYSYTMREEGK